MKEYVVAFAMKIKTHKLKVSPRRKFFKDETVQNRFKIVEKALCAHLHQKCVVFKVKLKKIQNV